MIRKKVYLILKEIFENKGITKAEIQKKKIASSHGVFKIVNNLEKVNLIFYKKYWNKKNLFITKKGQEVFINLKLINESWN